MKAKLGSDVSRVRTKSISLEDKERITSLRILTRKERQIADAEAAVGVVLDQIATMRKAGVTFAKIQRIFAAGGVEIELTMLRKTFEKLDAERQQTTKQGA
ncbi:hypothetical protein PWP93_36275 [Paraburkholderia sp. A1RI-2L]|uniref:hypothetical protein n=1 Tax=Paraburkholderia sp. A1RI-2L TaxID=3028367 RepID=UPI003B805297